MPKIINLWDIALIAVVVIGTHVLLRPLYNVIDNATMSGGK